MKAHVTYLEDSPRRSEPPPLSKAAELFLVIAVALLLLVPCFWQPHIAAGDLASHSYNAWLANEVREGRAPGITIVRQTTNVLVDSLLDFMLNRFGRQWAEPVVISAAVETMFWGAFAWISIAHRRKSWLIAPSLGMLAYGLIFHFGFVNFYLSTGLSLCILALLWRPTKRRAAAASVLGVMALLAHAMPLLWALAMLCYWHISQKFPAPQRPVLLVAGGSVVALVQVVLTTFLPNRWTMDQIFSLNGVAGLFGIEQVWLYGGKYLPIAIGLFLLWGVLFLERLDAGGLLSDPLAHLWLLNLLAFVIMPTAIQFPGTDFPLLYIPQRLSLFGGLTFLAVVGGGKHGRSVTRSSALLAGVFFTALFLDVRAYNRIEQEVTALLVELPPGQRVVAAMRDVGSPRINGLVHIGSGACIGRCYDYGNYEPATKQFRLRMTGPSPVNVQNMVLVGEIEDGRHTVTKEEAPVYSICQGKDASALILKRLNAGDKTCVVDLHATAQLTD